MRYKLKSIANIAIRYIVFLLLAVMIASRPAMAGSTQILVTINSLKDTLAQVGPALSAVLFIIAGIFYAVGQMLPPDKKANFHTAAINIIIGAVVVGVLSVASTSLALASTHLLSNFTNAS
ncbi:MAG: hypothetical protein QXW10_00130 [Candidatus Micrarchaeaceae archaeon]